MGRMLDDPDGRASPRKLHRSGGQTCDEAEQVQRHLVSDLRRQSLGSAGLPVSVRQQIAHDCRTARGAVPRGFPELRVPEHVIPIRMRRKTCRHRLTQLAKVLGQTGHL
jgi:hypothetical protein